ncbi:MAG: DUF2281 domain-containing protein [Saprospiraceae bacterium]
MQSIKILYRRTSHLFSRGHKAKCPFPEQLVLLEMLVQEIKKQMFTGEKPIAKKRKAGFSKATFVMSDDFNEPLEDFKEYMQ